MKLPKRIGVMVPSTNTTCEGDFQLVAPRGVTIHGQRLWLTNETLSEQGMDRMNSEIQTGARYLATAKVDVIAYACTTGSFYRGPGWDREMLELIERTAKVPAVATSPSVVDALRFLKAKRISVATPYPEWSNLKLKTYLEAAGFEVLNIAGEPHAAQSGNQAVNDELPDRIAEFAVQICRPEADALLCACTAWRSLEVASALEDRTGRPVVTSNQATIWNTFRTVGIQKPLPGFGSLLAP
jgi:maleate isomerase